MSSNTPLPLPQENVKPKDYYAKFTVCQSALPFCWPFSPGTPRLGNRTRNIPSMSSRYFLRQWKLKNAHSPCEDASKASLACMDQNDYNRDKCMEYFQAYRDCKRAWVRIASVMLTHATLLSSHTTLTDRAKTDRPSAWPSNAGMRIVLGLQGLGFASNHDSFR